MKLKDIKNMVNSGMAEDVTTKEANFFDNLTVITKEYSFGVYGMNGCIFKDSNGKIYAIVGRNTNLWRI